MMKRSTSIVISTKHILVFLFLLSQVNSQQDEEDTTIYTVQYNKDNFAEALQKNNHVVMFYAPWCGHCQRMAPQYEKLAKQANEDKSNVIIAKVDCTIDSELCTEHDVTGYPTFKFFKAGETKGTKFRDAKDLPSLISFIVEQLGTPFGDPHEAPSAPDAVNGLLELTEDTFDKHVSSGYHFVNFYAPWCGFCRELAPAWEELANSLRNSDHVSISKVDCHQHRSVCTQFDIKGYPTLLWIEDGKKVEKYTGQRTHEELKVYVSKMLANDNDQVDVKTDSSDSTLHAVLSLTGDSFKHGIETGVSFVKFFAPWCGHCKRLAPIWEDLGKKFFGNENVNIAKVDCTLDVSKDLCNKQDVDGFPSLYLYRDGQKVSEYNGARNLDDLYDFVLNNVQLHDEL